MKKKNSVEKLIVQNDHVRVTAAGQYLSLGFIFYCFHFYFTTSDFQLGEVEVSRTRHFVKLQQYVFVCV